MAGQINDPSKDKVLNLDLADYWMVIQKRALDIVLVFLLVLLAAYALTRRQRPEYEARCKIKIAARQPMATIEGAQITWYGGGQATSIQSEMELMLNKDSIAKLVEQIIKDKDNSTLFKENQQYLTASEIRYIKSIKFDFENERIESLTDSAIKGKVSAEALPSSDIVVIKVTDEEPRLAEVLANVYAMSYMSYFWKSKSLDAKET